MHEIRIAYQVVGYLNQLRHKRPVLDFNITIIFLRKTNLTHHYFGRLGFR